MDTSGDTQGTFLGILLTIIVVGTLLCILVNTAMWASKANDPLQLSLEEMQIWMDDLELQAEGIITKTKKAQETLITLDVFAREWVWTIRDEIDDWNRAGGE